MIPLSADEAGYALHLPPLRQDVTGVSADTRTLRPGDLFVALIGERFNGHHYVEAAFAVGASGAVVQAGAGAEQVQSVVSAPERDRLYVVPDTLVALGDLARAVRQKSSAIVIAVTGSMGKTGTKDLIRSMAGMERVVLATEFNLNNEVGVPLTLLQIDRSTELVVVEMGNDLKQLKAKEQMEIARILQALSDQIAPHGEAIHTNIDLLTQLDLAFAKGLLAREMSAVLPKLNQRGYIKIVRGRHPLIDPQKVVPSDLWLGDQFTTLIITGPNTGGKTVTLKTVGLFTLMAQAGLHVPAQLGTELAVFHRVFADIGDEQSIEQSLSTFSSHMKNIVDIMTQVTQRDLVLFDELGAGTDPTEGAALAQSILMSLLSRGVRSMATTHYSELKAFALSTPGIENASVEFDVESLRPTYRLSIGIPGKSNAFEISRKLGLPEELIDRARELLSKEDIRFEDVIANAEYHRQVAERERALAEETRQETVRMRDEAERLRREMEQAKQKYMQKAKEDARRVLENARREAEGIIGDLKALRKQANSPMAQAQALQKRMEQGIDALSEGLAQPNEFAFTPPKTVRVGETVEVVHLKTMGTVLSLPDNKGEVQIQAGIMKLKAHLSQLKIVEPVKEKVSRVLTKTGTASRTVAMEVDVRGMALDEALPAVDTYLDEATLAGLQEVSIIHGKGTGVLRTGIQRHLKTHMHVKSYRDGLYGEGEHGVTVVKLK